MYWGGAEWFCWSLAAVRGKDCSTDDLAMGRSIASPCSGWAVGVDMHSTEILGCGSCLRRHSTSGDSSSPSMLDV